MMYRLFVLISCLVLSSEAFAPARLAFAPHASSITNNNGVLVEPLFACRTNAKKEKRQRNRENMRKFKKTGRRGTSRRKMMKKALASKARQEEMEFISKCFITAPSGEEEESTK